MNSPRLEDGEQLFLRGCQPGGLSKNNFQWPLEVGAVVTAPDWNPEPVCGQGLHGNLNGGGNYSLLVNSGPGLVVAAKNAVDLDGKHKFQSCRILFVGKTLMEAATWLACHPDSPKDSRVHYVSLTGGDCSTLTGGDCSTLKGGDRSTLTGGYRSILTGGYGSTLTGGDCSTLTGGDDSTLTGGYGSTLTGGDDSTLTGGYSSTLTGGDSSTLTGGDRSTLKGGYGSTAKCGIGGVIALRRSSGTLKCSEVGPGGLKPDVRYRLNDKDEFEEVAQ